MNEFEKSINTAKQYIRSILAEQRKKEYESIIEAATHIAARSQIASEAAKGNEPLNRKERARFNQQVKPLEAAALKVWAQEINLWIDDSHIKEIAKRYIDEGAEQKVYLKQDGRTVLKINTGIFHGTWLDFLVGILLKNSWWIPIL